MVVLVEAGEDTPTLTHFYVDMDTENVNKLSSLLADRVLWCQESLVLYRLESVDLTTKITKAYRFIFI